MPIPAEAARVNRAMIGERRVVTILFCDVKGSTAMAESLDPEEWAEIMNEAYAYLSEPVYRYEGTVARLMGDAILAFFGAPISHEDDPQRAVMAALEMIDEMQPFRKKILRRRGLDFNVRIGLNTGLVVVGDIGSDLKVEYTVMGDAVNIAARMEQSAIPGTVQVAANTYRQVKSLFDFESLGTIEVKGKAEPVEAYRVLRKREGAKPSRGFDSLQSPMVGRERELELLGSFVADLSRGSGRIVSVVGEAGLGKSRLMSELHRAVETGMLGPPSQMAPTAAVHWYEGRSFSYETTVPYAPFKAFLSDVFGLRGLPDDAARVTRIAQRLDDLFPSATEKLTPYLASLLELALAGDDLERVKYLEPPQLRGRVFHAVIALVERLAQSEPMVLVFEDLHWADPTSLELLRQLMPICASYPLLLVALFRPQRQDASWQFHVRGAEDFGGLYTQIVLQPLDEAQSRTLVSNLLHIEDLPPQVRALILKKAEGNPFFVEEVIRSLLDSGLVVHEDGHWRATRDIANIAVPDTLAGVITARLDKLDEPSRRVAQTAAVIGREFAYDVLNDVCQRDDRGSPEMQVEDLERRELIRASSRVPSLVYMFKHVLTQETAYASLLLSRRRGVHLMVAECLETRRPEAVNEIGRHFLEAKAELRALPYLVKAGGQALRAYANQEAQTLLQQALDVVLDNNSTDFARPVYEGLGKALLLAGDVQAAHHTYQEMASFADSSGDTPMKVSALNQLAMISMWSGKLPEMMQQLDESEQLAERADDLVGLAEGYTMRCMSCNMLGDFSNAIRYLNSSVEIGKKLQSKEQTAFALAHTSQTMLYMTEFESSYEKAQESLRIATELDDRPILAELLAFQIPYFHLRQGDMDTAAGTAARAVEIASSAGIATWEAMAYHMLGTIACWRGDYEKAIALLERSVLASEQSGYSFAPLYPWSTLGSLYLEISPALADRTREYHQLITQRLQDPVAGWAISTVQAELGFSALELGDIEQAAELFGRGLAGPAPEMFLNRPRFLAGSALAALAKGDLEAVGTYADQAWEFVEQRKMTHVRPLVSLVRGRVALATGNAQGALERFEASSQAAAALTMRPALWQAKAATAEALQALGKPDQAATRLQEARAILDDVAALFQDEELRSLFLADSSRKLGKALLAGNHN